MFRVGVFFIASLVISCASSKPAADEASQAETDNQTTTSAAEADPCATLESDALAECRLEMATLEAVCTNGAFTQRGCLECPDHEGLDGSDDFFELVSIESLEGPDGADLEKKVLIFDGCRPDDARTRFELVAGDHETPWVIDSMGFDSPRDAAAGPILSIEIDQVKGIFTAKEVHRFVNREKSELESCFDKGEKGEFSFKFIITHEGVVPSATTIGTPNVDAETLQCTLSKVREWAFDTQRKAGISIVQATIRSKVLSAP